MNVIFYVCLYKVRSSCGASSYNPCDRSQLHGRISSNIPIQTERYTASWQQRVIGSWDIRHATAYKKWRILTLIRQGRIKRSAIKLSMSQQRVNFRWGSLTPPPDDLLMCWDNLMSGILIKFMKQIVRNFIFQKESLNGPSFGHWLRFISDKKPVGFSSLV